MYKYRITVFTPTYNRAYIIENLYRSLQKQQFNDFEWLVVDDGSTDDTEGLFSRWQNEENAFVIRYCKTPNGGKHRAINKGLDLAEGEIFFTMDSDDTLTEDALLKVDKWFDEIKDEPHLAGIIANRGYTKDDTINPPFHQEYLDKTMLDMYTYRENDKLVLNGERAIIFYTDIHKKYRFPEFEGENFMTECVVYNRMAKDGYKMRFYKDIIWIFEYLEDGLTKSGTSIFLKNPRGYGLSLAEKAKFLGDSLSKKLRMYYTFTCDLSSLYNTKTISECIGAPHIIIKLCNMVHNLRVKNKKHVK